MKNTIKEAILKSLEMEARLMTYLEVYDVIIDKKLYEFIRAKTPTDTVGALLGDFIRNGDQRVKRIRIDKQFRYYLAKYEADLDLDNINLPEKATKIEIKEKSYSERDLHMLLSSFLKNNRVYSKTILHEKSKNSKDSHQKWIHPDMVGVEFLNLQNKASQSLLNAVKRTDSFKLASYEIKKEINSDYELKKCFFQAVSNSSWANFGYLVAFEFADSLMEELERLNQSFGIGVIELSGNPYESKLLFPPRLNPLDYKTIDKLCKVSQEFEAFISQTEKLLTVEEKYHSSVESEMESFCDKYFETDSEIGLYCKKKNIPYEEVEE